jgi:anti-sigma regulatory factor (Ser/Thr protein kinase)
MLEAHLQSATAHPPTEPQANGLGVPGSAGSFRHEALLYAGEAGFLDGTLPPIERALRRGEPVLVAVAWPRAQLLRDALGEPAQGVDFLDMHELGRNPARIIPAWQRFLDRHASVEKPLLGIGEPVWPGRSATEMGECRRHESLLNLAFGGGRAWRLLCPYDLEGLNASTIDAAGASHPFLADADRSSPSARYCEAPGPRDAFAGVLPEPAGAPEEIVFDREQLSAARHLVAACAASAGLSSARSEALVLAVSELASNSVLHGGGAGRLRVWQEGHALLCDVRDAGRIALPLAGRIEPRVDQLAGRGLWLANQLCDLVQIRSGEAGTIARLHMDLQRTA